MKKSKNSLTDMLKEMECALPNPPTQAVYEHKGRKIEFDSLSAFKDLTREQQEAFIARNSSDDTFTEKVKTDPAIISLMAHVGALDDKVTEVLNLLRLIGSAVIKEGLNEGLNEGIENEE